MPDPQERRKSARRGRDVHSDAQSTKAQARLRHLYEISRHLATFGDIDVTLPAILAVIVQTLPLRSAILFIEGGGGTRATVWPADLPSQDPAYAHARRLYQQVVQSPSAGEQAATSAPEKFVMLPLVVAEHPPFGAFQIEADALGEDDLVFVSAIVNQLAIAVDRHRAWQADVTERKRAQAGELRQEHLASDAQAGRAEAEAENKAKDDFLAVLSHELRTPLNAIIGWTHLLQVGSLDAEASKRALETVARNARLQNQLISDMLDLQRIISGKVSMERRPIDPAAAIVAACETLAPVAKAKQVEVKLSLDDAGAVLGDADRLQQIVWNLLANAIKFTFQGGRVDVFLQRSATEVVITVADDGPGVPAKVLPHIFERFRQGDASSTRQHGGLGLGLAIVRSLVELHGGTVTAANRGARSGAIFTVILPRLADRIAGAAGIERESEHIVPHASSLGGIRIVLVDDSADDREVLSSLLQDGGAEVIAVASGAEALDVIERERPDLVLSDIAMPDEDGYAFMRRLRALPRERGGLTPAIALTAYASEGDRLRVLEGGFQAHIAKPVDPVRLIIESSRLAGRATQ